MSSNEGSTPYYRAARFNGEQSAGTAYFQLRDFIFAPECDLSAYRFLRNDVWHVAVVGESPPGQLRQEIEAALAAGESVKLDRQTRQWLLQRREQQSSKGPWIDGHYHPGRGFRIGR